MKVDLKEYLLLINFDDFINNKIIKMKKVLEEKVGIYPGRTSIPHVSLMSFKTSLILEDRVVSTMKRSLEGTKSFNLQLEGFEKFDSSTTLFVKIATKEQIMHINERIKRNIKAIVSKTNFHCYNTPHITIGRGLVNEKFEKGWAIFREMKFQDSIQVSNVRLLRFDGSRYDPIANFFLPDNIECVHTN